jgi:hypothetical protein
MAKFAVQVMVVGFEPEDLTEPGAGPRGSTPGDDRHGAVQRRPSAWRPHRARPEVV